AHGRHLQPEGRRDRAAAARVPTLPPARRGGRRSAQSRARRGAGRPRARAAAGVARVRRRVIADTAIVYPGTIVPDDCTILDYAVSGKHPPVSPRSTAKREALPPLELGPGTVVSTGAVVFAGTRIGARVIVGDQACVRERCDLGDDVVLGRGSLVEN